MGNQLADVGHVRYVRKWLKHNAERIAAAVEPPEKVDQHLSGADFVRWLEKLMESHQRVCQQEYDRSGRNGPVWTGD
jgi:hypothetical protein